MAKGRFMGFWLFAISRNFSHLCGSKLEVGEERILPRSRRINCGVDSGGDDQIIRKAKKAQRGLRLSEMCRIKFQSI
jgi:hypothetical protein